MRGLKQGSLPLRLTLGSARFLGLMSYSVYLLHGRVQFLAHQFSRQLLSPGILFDLAVIGVTCAMCAMFYWCCLTPAKRPS